MQVMKARSLLSSQRITNMFGAVGYSLLIVNYAIVVGAVLLWVINSGYGDIIGVPPNDALSPEDTGALVEPGESNTPLLFEIMAYVITMVMGMVVIFVTITLPYWLGRSGSMVLKRLIRIFYEPITPVVLLLAKVIANGIVAVPMLVIVANSLKDIPALIVVSGLVFVALIMFLLQHYLAKMNNLEAKNIW